MGSDLVSTVILAILSTYDMISIFFRYISIYYYLFNFSYVNICIVFVYREFCLYYMVYILLLFAGIFCFDKIYLSRKILH